MHLTYWFKQVVGAAATPMMCGLLVVIAGGIVRLLDRRRLSNGLWMGAALLVYLSATAPVADALLSPLESRYPPLRDIQTLPPVQFIVVLGSGYGPRDGIPVTAAFTAEGLARIAEGVRLMRLIRGARLIVSGGAPANRAASAVGYAKFAVEFGIDENAIIKLDKSLDTAEEAESVAEIVGTSPFLLVTSACHMPRAMRLMQRAGTHPIAAPTGQLASPPVYFGVQGWLPSSGSLRKTEYAIHEYIGLAIVR